MYGAVINGRRGIGVELKTSYYAQAVKNLEDATNTTAETPDDQALFAGEDEPC